MNTNLGQAFRNEQDFDDFLDERDAVRDKIVVAEAERKMLIGLYTEGLLSAEAAAKKLNMTVPAFLELVKAKASV